MEEKIFKYRNPSLGWRLLSISCPMCQRNNKYLIEIPLLRAFIHPSSSLLTHSITKVKEIFYFYFDNVFPLSKTIQMLCKWRLISCLSFSKFCQSTLSPKSNNKTIMLQRTTVSHFPFPSPLSSPSSSPRPAFISPVQLPVFPIIQQAILWT